MSLLGFPVAGVTGVAAVPNDATVSNYCHRTVTVVLGLAVLPAGNAILTPIHGEKGRGATVRQAPGARALRQEPWVKYSEVT